MSMFNKLLRRKDDSPPKDNANSTSPGRDLNSTGGFLCPLCYQSFENSDLLTTHFNRVHDEPTEENSSNTSYSEQPNLKKSSSRSSFNPKIESILKKYTNDAGDQDSKSTASYDPNESLKSNLEAELKTWKEQLQLSEDTRLTLSSDLLQYQDENKKMSTKLNKLNKEREKYENTLQSIKTELKHFKSTSAELQTENEMIKNNSLLIQEEFIAKSQQVSQLENELSSRPTTDDLNLLKEEIVKVQTLMDTVVKEKENQYMQLQRDYDNLKESLEKKNNDLKNESLNELENLTEELKGNVNKINENLIVKYFKKEIEYQNQILATTEALESKDKDLNDLNLSISQLKQELISKDSRIKNLESETQELTEQHDQLRQSITDLEQKKVELYAKLERTNNNKELSDSEREIELKNSNKSKENIELELTKCKSKIQVYSEEKLRWLNEKNEFLSSKQILDSKILELENQIKQQEAETAKIKTDKETLGRRIEGLEVEKLNLTNMNLNIKMERDSLDKQVSVYESQISEHLERINQLNMDMLEIKLDNQVLKEELTECKCNIEKKDSQISDLDLQITSINDKLLKSKSENESLISKNENLINDVNTLTNVQENNTRELVDLKEQIKELETNYSNQSDKLTEEMQEKDKLSKQCLELSSQLGVAKSEQEDLEEKLMDLEKDFNEVKTNYQALEQKLEDAKNENSFFKTNLITLKKFNKIKTETELNKTNATLSTDLAQLIKDIEIVKQERDECENQRLESSKKNQLNSQALNQNLANLRTELKQLNDKLAQSEVTINSIRGDNLEMEAKLSICMDERNQLLERCLISEKLLETTKNNNVELKRRFEDTQAALQELGREHQELQIQNYKKSNYKWVDDSQAKDCTQCKKIFSVTIRKHHCRNCGQVYCYECSDHTAIVSSSAKPQRVCKACFIEINN